MDSFYRTICLVWIALLFPFPPLLAQTKEYKYPESAQLVALVDEAVVLIRQEGPSAFKEFMIPGSKWRKGDIYIFVIDLNGKVSVHEDTTLIGKNLFDLKDKNGKPFIKWFIQKATTDKEGGWTHYLWTKPGSDKSLWKTTYVKLAKTSAGKEYVVGCGLYDMKMEKAFAVDAVDDAAALIRKEGKKALQILKDTTSEFVYKDTYVFVLDSTCVLLVDPPFPKLEGINVINYKGMTGKYVFREFMKTAKEKGSGWVDYLWPKPGETVQSNKTSYVKKVNLSNGWYVVGTGIYLE